MGGRVDLNSGQLGGLQDGGEHLQRSGERHTAGGLESRMQSTQMSNAARLQARRARMPCSLSPTGTLYLPGRCSWGGGSNTSAPPAPAVEHEQEARTQ